MKGLPDTISASVERLGQSFILAYYLPAMIFVLIHSHLLLPMWPQHWLAAPASISAPASDENAAEPASPATSLFNLRELANSDLDSIVGNALSTLLMPLLVGIILVGLNSSLIRAFEGKLPWLQYGLLAPLLKRNRKKSQELYQDLRAAREAYDEIKTKMARADSDQERLKFSQLLESVEATIRQEHSKIEAQYPLKILPYDLHRVTPTRFGNTYAVAEEYPYECYGADAVLFWARLREMMHTAAPEHSERITQQKTSLDMLINFAVLFGLLSLETWLLVAVNFNVALLTLGILGSLLCVAFHQSSVNAMRLMGELIKNSFDYYRGLILDSFGLETPADLETERQVWNDLAAFIRRGDPFYFPAKFKKEPTS